MTEAKVLDAVALVLSIPLPEEEIAAMELTKEGIIATSSRSLLRYLDEKQQRKPKKPETKKREITDEEIIQYTDLEFSFVLNGKLIVIRTVD